MSMTEERHGESTAIATYVLIHGAGDVGWYWHLVGSELRGRGHDVVAVDLPVDDASAGLSKYADVVVAAIGDRSNLIVVAQSFGGYVAPIVCDRVPARLLVLVAGMVPSPGESAEEMFARTGYKQEEQEDPSDLAVFYHDVPPGFGRRGSREGGETSRAPRPRSHGRWRRGRTFPRDTCSVGMTVSSRPRGCVPWCETAWDSIPTRSKAATAPPSVDPGNWQTVWSLTGLREQPNEQEVTPQARVCRLRGPAFVAVRGTNP